MTMDISRYRYLSDDELLNLIDEKRQHSPLINLLCCRLEEALKEQVIEYRLANSDTIIECPVCESKLQLQELLIPEISVQKEL